MNLLKSMNNDQRSLAKHPFVLLGMYFKRTWRQLVTGPLLSVLMILIFSSIANDAAIKAQLHSNGYLKHVVAVCRGIQDQRLLCMVAILLLISFVLPGGSLFTIRLGRSWTSGVWQIGPVLCSWVTIVLIMSKHNHLLTVVLSALIFLADVSFFGIAQIRRLGRLNPASVLSARNPAPKPRLAKRSDSDAITDWSQDKLQRSSIVDTLLVQLLVGEIPVIALRGKFGEGKSSILNLLREDLAGHAIVVSFSSWLPGSEETLTKELFHDISKECRKHYYLPGLGRALARYASIFSADVPYLKGIREILGPLTQRQELEQLQDILQRLPKRIVVLLDEVDRMRRKELVTLLKLIRGTGAVANLSYLCAFDREHVEKTVCRVFDKNSHEYFEKFFPYAMDLPAPDPALLKAEFMTALLSTNAGSSAND